MAYAYTKFTTYSKLSCVDNFQFYFKVESVVRVCFFLVVDTAFLPISTTLYRNSLFLPETLARVQETLRRGTQ
jgi:hypothetical protein